MIYNKRCKVSIIYLKVNLFLVSKASTHRIQDREILELPSKGDTFDSSFQILGQVDVGKVVIDGIPKLDGGYQMQQSPEGTIDTTVDRFGAGPIRHFQKLSVCLLSTLKFCVIEKIDKILQSFAPLASVCQ